MKKFSYIAIFLSFVFISCSGKINAPKRKYNVTVQANGKSQTGNTPQLVHRVSFSKKEVQKIFGTPKNPKIPFIIGKPTGSNKTDATLKLISANSVTDSLNLKKGDVITSIEGKLITDPADLKVLPKMISESSEVGISYQRRGQIMKTIIYQSK